MGKTKQTTASSKIHSFLCKVACEQNSRGLKISVVSRRANSCERKKKQRVVMVVITVVYVV